jgi:HEAT repeat protein
LELTVLAIQILGRVGDVASAGQLIYLTAVEEGGRTMPPEVRLAAADAMARLGRTEGWFIADAYAGDERPLVRAQAAIVYGQTRGPENLQKLARLIADPAAVVRVAAAAAVLEQYGEGASRVSAR